MDGAMKESMISFLDKNLSIRLAKVRRPIEGVTRYAILILQCWWFCPRTIFDIHYVIEFVLVGISSVAMLTFKIRAFPGADAIWNKVISEAAEAAEGEEAGEDEVIKIDPADKQFER